MELKNIIKITINLDNMKKFFKHIIPALYLLPLFIIVGLIMAGGIYTCIGIAIITIPIIALILFFLYGIYDINKRDKEVCNYLADCKKKYENGEMSKEEYDDIYTTWVLDYNGY